MKRAVETAERLAAQLHTRPERSFQEFETTRIVREFCRAQGLRLLDLGMETGAVALLEAGKPELVALRADLDAVDTEHGPAHLCGHDYHTAAALGAAQYLAEHRQQLTHDVVFLFQPAEECTQGARAMLDHGLLAALGRRPVRLFGIHNRPELLCGEIAVHTGPLMAEKSNFVLRLQGRTGHGGTPQVCVDPIAAAAQFIVAAQSIVSRNVDPLEAAVCSVCSIHSGTAANFAPEQAVLTGSVRTLRHDVHLRVCRRLETLAHSTAEGFECRCDWTLEHQVPAVDNSAALAAVARCAAQRTGRVVDTRPCLGSEDFAVLGQEMPGFFYWVGSGAAGEENAVWHSPQFRVRPGYLDTAVPLLVYSALEGD